MRRNLLLVMGAMFAAPIGAMAATNPAIDKLEAKVLAKFKGAPPARIIQILGAPNASAEREGKEYLTWETGKSSGAYLYGVGGSESYSCRATFDFLEGALTDVSFLALGRGDRRLCENLMKPLLRDSTGPSSGGNTSTSDVNAPPAAAAPPVLTNSDIVKFTVTGLPDSVILAKINGSRCSFDLSTDALVALKQAGVRDPVIEAMMSVVAKK